ncbi:MAG: hypothetical protein SGPRY_013116 [Prymnesium sp.]
MQAWPGQACAYKLGEIAILRARRHAERVLGEAFDLREFHKTVLSTGPTALSVMEEAVGEWARNVVKAKETA